MPLAMPVIALQLSHFRDWAAALDALYRADTQAVKVSIPVSMFHSSPRHSVIAGIKVTLPNRVNSRVTSLPNQLGYLIKRRDYPVVDSI
jgi:hypothetical protein